MNRHSTGIEICAFGYLKDGKTYVNTSVREDQIATLVEHLEDTHSITNTLTDRLRKLRSGLSILLREIKLM